jgi:transcriptional regulator with XRE-family HTH domain
MENRKLKRAKFPANVSGPQIKRLRLAKGWSQAKLAERLQLSGLDVGRDTVARVECQAHGIRDMDIPFFARSLGVEISRLFMADDHKWFPR